MLSADQKPKYGDWWSKLDKSLTKFNNNGFLSDDYIGLYSFSLKIYNFSFDICE